jgi:hypothetical protein
MGDPPPPPPPPPAAAPPPETPPPESFGSKEVKARVLKLSGLASRTRVLSAITIGAFGCLPTRQVNSYVATTERDEHELSREIVLSFFHTLSISGALLSTVTAFFSFVPF